MSRNRGERNTDTHPFATSSASTHSRLVGCKTPTLLSRSPHPFIRGTQFCRKTTASGHFEHAKRECPALPKRVGVFASSTALYRTRIGLAIHAISSSCGAGERKI